MDKPNLRDMTLEELQAFLAGRRVAATVSAGSSLKLCLVAAGEAAVGLGILLALFRMHQTTELDRARELEG